MSHRIFQSGLEKGDHGLGLSVDTLQGPESSGTDGEIIVGEHGPQRWYRGFGLLSEALKGVARSLAHARLRVFQQENQNWHGRLSGRPKQSHGPSMDNEIFIVDSNAQNGK